VSEIDSGKEAPLGETAYGSFLVSDLAPHGTYTFRVRSRSGRFTRTVTAATGGSEGPAAAPFIATPWRSLFRPTKAGDYINDHTIYRTDDGMWHMVGITAHGEGDYSKETRFAHGIGRTLFPPAGETMRETDPVADFGHLAWAPHVLREKGKYRMWFSPHRCYAATSVDGYRWREEKGIEFLPANPQFRDAMVLRVADGQWLMYATARDGYYSTVDLYQSFDLEHWQYIGAALKTGFGCERAGAQASTESPFVLRRDGRYYLSVTYNNDSFFWNPLLLTVKVWLHRESYNDTLVFSSTCPYDFGVYRGRNRPSHLVASLRAHGPEYIEEGGTWYVTTAGWPWMASLTRGEAAVAELGWKAPVAAGGARRGH
jgi:arabinan endo-1,5-alpha-L-arabinosidase